MVVENVRGAQKWVGRAQWNYGSFYLWGDVPALMPFTLKQHSKIESAHLRLNDPSRANVQRLMATVPKLRPARAGYEGQKVAGFCFDGSGKSFQTASVEGLKLKDQDGYERTHPQAFGWKAPRTSSRSNSRKAASAMIAKIPCP